MTPENPSAFPSIEQWNEWSELKAEYVPKTGPRGGMTLRDWFAGQALVGMLSQPADASNVMIYDDTNTAARWAYGFADAMLAEREKQS